MTVQEHRIILLEHTLAGLMAYTLCALPSKADIQVCQDITEQTGVRPLQIDFPLLSGSTPKEPTC